MKSGAQDIDIDAIRDDFPILSQKNNNRPLLYLDNAATTQKPKLVIDAMFEFYGQYCANIHRGAYAFSEHATLAFEQARLKVRDFLHANDAREIIFVRNATEGINLVAQSWGRSFLCEGDEIILSVMEHHSNIVPWQIVCEQTGARLRIIPINEEGELDFGEFEKLINDKTRMVGITHVSNVLGTINPIARIIELAHQVNALALVDAAQSAPHIALDVQALKADFLVFSGHKIYGPCGVGIVWGREELLQKMAPYQVGGGMISSVSFEKTSYANIPRKFEAGTPDIAAAIGLGAAIDYLNYLNFEKLNAHESELLSHGASLLKSIPGLRLVGTAREKLAVLSFVLDGVDAHELAILLGKQNIAIRAGQHCAQPLHDRLGLMATARVSIGIYNTKQELERMAELVDSARQILC